MHVAHTRNMANAAEIIVHSFTLNLDLVSHLFVVITLCKITDADVQLEYFLTE
jgi:hypothetical protein